MKNKLHKLSILFVCLFGCIMIGFASKSLLAGIIFCIVLSILGIFMLDYLNGDGVFKNCT